MADTISENQAKLPCLRFWSREFRSLTPIDHHTTKDPAF